MPEKQKNDPSTNFYHVDMNVRLRFPDTPEALSQLPVRYYAVVNVREEDLHKVSSQADLQTFIDPRMHLADKTLSHFMDNNPHLKQKVREAKVIVEDGPRIRKVRVDHVPIHKRDEYLQFIEESLPYVIFMNPLAEN
jgi:hypothetical protein